MRTHRLYTNQELAPGRAIGLDGNTAHYLLRVLRVTHGQQLVLFNGDGHDYVAEVDHAGKREVRLVLLSKLPALAESPLHITLVQALSRGERMDVSLKKATELGATTFQLLLSERVEVRLKPDKLEKRLTHWRAVIISACEQSGRARVPELESPLSLQEWLAQESDARRLVLAPRSDRPLAKTAVTDRVALLVGPEGGFTAAELELMDKNGVTAVSLGPRILRTETAGPAAIAVLQSLAGDFG